MHSPRSAIWFGGIAMVLIMEFASLLEAVRPRLSLHLGAPVDRSNILSAPAILSNDGIFSISDVSVTCTGPGTITETEGTMTFPAISRLHVTAGIAKVGGRQHIVVPDVCRYRTIQHPLSAEVVVRIDFKPSFLPRDHREFHIKSTGALERIAGPS